MLTLEPVAGVDGSDCGDSGKLRVCKTEVDLLFELSAARIVLDADHVELGIVIDPSVVGEACGSTSQLCSADEDDLDRSAVGSFLEWTTAFACIEIAISICSS